MTSSVRRLEPGFSLLELMVTLAVLAVLTAIAVPNFRYMIRRNAVTSQSNALLASIQYARNDAVSRRVVTVICSSTDTLTCAGSNAFESGWIVYRETAPGPTAALDSKDEVLRVVQTTQNVTIRAVDAASGKPVSAFSFDQQGSVLGDIGINFLICSKPDSAASAGESTSTVQGVQISLSASGRPASGPVAAGASCG